MCQKQFNSLVRIDFINLYFNENGTGSNKVCEITAWSIGFENHTSCHINGCKHVLVTNQQLNKNQFMKPEQKAVYHSGSYICMYDCILKLIPFVG